MTSVTFQGRTYSDDGSSTRDMRGGGHRHYLLPMLGDAMLDLSASVTDATAAQAAAELASDQANTSASAAAGSAATALAAQGQVATDRAATQTALAQAQTLVGTAGTGTATGLAYAALTKSLVAATDVVAVHIYDTRQDSDGGAWAARPCGSWYWEALGTATRGATRRFPAVALLVLRTTSLTIYDCHDLDVSGVPRMWMVFTSSATASYALYAGGGIVTTGIFALNGRVFVTSNTGGIGGLTEIDFPGDRSHVRRDSDFAFNACRALVLRNSPLQSGGALARLADDACHAVHASVLPGAPLDSAGLPIPTVAVATAAGASVIHPWGLVCDITYAGGYRAVQCGVDGRLDLSAADAARIDVGHVLYADAAHTAWRTGALTPSTVPALLAPTGTSRMVLSGSRAAGCADGLTLRAPDMSDPSKGMAAFIATTSNTGWMPGDIRGAWLCDTTVGSVTGVTLPDRSYKGGGLTVAGTLNRTALPCGLAYYSPASASACPTQTYSADLDPATGDLMAAAWLRETATGGRTVLERAEYTSAYGASSAYRLGLQASSLAAFSISNNGWSTSDSAVGTVALNDGAWHLVLGVRRGGMLEIWVDGVRQGGATITNATGSLSNPAAQLVLGRRWDGTALLTDFLLTRISAYAPTPVQIRRMWEDERALIIGGTPATLGGTSNDVRALAFSETVGTLAIGTGDGVSVFAGLGRVQYLDGASGGAAIGSDAIVGVAASGPHLLVATAGNAGLISDAVIARDRLAPAGPPRALLTQDRQVLAARGVTVDATPTDLSPRIYIGEREAVTLDVTVQARTYGASSPQGGMYRRLARYIRDAGGNVALAGAVQTIGADQETTAGMDVTLQIDTAAQTVTPRVTGVAGTRIVWAARITITRISEDLTYAAQ